METTTICIPRNAFIVLARTQVAFLTLSSADVSRNIHLLVVYLSFLHSILPYLRDFLTPSSKTFANLLNYTTHYYTTHLTTHSLTQSIN